MPQALTWNIGTTSNTDSPDETVSMPLGLHHIMARSHHQGPGPWVAGGRADWTSLYYHKADDKGLGFDRTASGSNAVAPDRPARPWRNSRRFTLTHSVDALVYAVIAKLRGRHGASWAVLGLTGALLLGMWILPLAEQMEEALQKFIAAAPDGDRKSTRLNSSH